MDIFSEGAQFDVLCKRCGKRITVTRNWGGGIRIDSPRWMKSNPAKCSNCGSMNFELW